MRNVSLARVPNPGGAVRIVTRSDGSRNKIYSTNAWADGRKIGYVRWSAQSWPRRHGDGVALDFIWLDHAARRGGLALALLDAVRRRAAKDGAATIFTEVTWRGSLLLMDMVFGAERRLFLGEDHWRGDSRPFSLTEAMAFLPSVSPFKTGAPGEFCSVYLDVVYRLDPASRATRRTTHESGRMH